MDCKVCDSGAVKTPSDWKTGGKIQVNSVTYRITPQIEQNYTAGKCWFHLEEFQTFSGPKNDQVIFEVQIKNVTDGSGKNIPIIGTEDNDTQSIKQVAGDGNPYVFNTTLPFPLVITPEFDGNPSNYIQFVYGSQSWTTSVDSGMPYCTVGGWDIPGTSLGAVSNRNMDCFFYC
ncbi:hypothetical protein ACHAPF_007081 [Botrytis cinerea]